MKNRKWWWTLFMWGLDVMIVNAFLLYTTAHLIIRSKKKDEVLSQYEFRKEIALFWIQKNMSDVAENDNNNKRGRYDIKDCHRGCQ